jgi:AraC-like DNA-binding protein
MLDSIVKILLAFGMGISLFVIFQLVREGKANFLPIKIGLAMLMVWFLRFSFFYIKFEEWTLNFPVLLVIDQYLFLLDGPLLWLYTRSVLESNRFNMSMLWHFTPFMVGIAISFTSAMLYPEEIVDSFKSSVAAILNNEPILQPEVIAFIVILIALTTFYFIKSRSALKRYNASLLDNYSNIESLKVNWVLSFQKLWIVLFGFPLVVYFLNYLYPTINVYVTGGILLISLLSLSMYVGSRLLTQSYTHVRLISKERVTTGVQAELTTSDRQQLQKLYQKLKNEKYYEDEQLSLNQLAGYLEMKPKDLTDLIKKSEYNNFYDLVNSFRVEAVKQALEETNEQIILIAYQCGFNSKSAFNKIFKQKTGLTPKEYRLSLK